MNEILLRRKNKVWMAQSGQEAHTGRVQPERPGSAGPETAVIRHIGAMMKNVEALGYTFSRELYEALLKLEKQELERFYLELVPALKKLAGADVEYHPMYPDFPESVMEEEEARLYINAAVHYWSFGTLYPAVEKKERLPLFDAVEKKELTLGTEEDLQEIFWNLCGSKTSLSQTDREDLEWIFRNLKVEFPPEIPLKENAALAGKLYLEHAPLASPEEIGRYFRTATDVLRLITAMSDGDVSLAENTRYRSFRRRERRFLMELLQGCRALEEDMLRYRERWIRVGERLHPGEYRAERFRRVRQAFDKVRGHGRIETYAGKVERALKAGDCREALALLRERPGELARRLDQLLRRSRDKDAVINAFKGAAREVSTPVLLQVRAHFLHRFPGGKEEAGKKAPGDVRVFFPKGNLARSHCVLQTLPEIEEKYCRAVAQICENALVEVYGKKEFMGSVYLSEEFRHYLVPFSQRSAGRALKTIVRGSRLPIAPNAAAVRAFVWWTNMAGDGEKGRVDLDLSAAVFDENWNFLTHVSYTNLRDTRYRVCHSGDIVNGGPVDGVGVSEFLDVDLHSVLQGGGRYVVYQVYSYTGQCFSEMPHAMFGWMSREDVGSGEIYEPGTVAQRMDLASGSRVCIPVIFDCAAGEAVWCDMGLSLSGCRSACGGNNLESNLSGVTAVCYGILHMHRPNLYDLIALHIKARGVRVDKKEEADIVFDVDSGITPFDTEVFMGGYL